MGVQKKADHRLQFRTVPVSHGNAQKNVVLAAVAIEQGIHGGSNDGKEAYPFSPAAVSQSQCQFRARFESDALRHDRKKLQDEVDLSADRAAQAPRAGFPPSKPSLGRTPLESRVAAASQRNRRAGSARPAAQEAGHSNRRDKSRQVSPKNTYRRPVTNDVMHHQDQDMIRPSKTEQGGADCRARSSRW